MAIDSALDAARKAGVDQVDLSEALLKREAGDAKLKVARGFATPLELLA